MVDLHLHLLPGLDDGPETLAGSVEHARRLVADGVTDAVVTPHVGHPRFDVDVREIAARTFLLGDALRRREIHLRLRPGGEIHPSALPVLTGAELAFVAQGPPEARWVLAEAPFAGVTDAFASACERVQHDGFNVLVAHPERSAGVLAGGLERLRGVLLRGGALQVNACSLAGRHGETARAVAEQLIRDGLAYVIASDGHGANRPLTQRDGFAAALAAGVGRVRARQLVEANPRFLLENGLPADRPDPDRARNLVRDQH